MSNNTYDTQSPIVENVLRAKGDWWVHAVCNKTVYVIDVVWLALYDYISPWIKGSYDIKWKQCKIFDHKWDPCNVDLVHSNFLEILFEPGMNGKIGRNALYLIVLILLSVNLYKYKRAQRALSRSPEEKVKGQGEAIILL